MTHLFLNAEVCVNMLMIPSLCALTKCLRTNRVLDDCPREFHTPPNGQSQKNSTIPLQNGYDIKTETVITYFYRNVRVPEI